MFNVHNKVVWKYPFRLADKFMLQVPVEGEVLSLQVDQKTNLPCIWFLVNPAHKTEVRNFEIYDTGEYMSCDINTHRIYIGTFQLDGGDLIAHVFERVNPKK